MRKCLYLLLYLVLANSCSTSDSGKDGSIKLTEAETRMPENALAGLEVGNGLEAQLFASEPLVRNPSNIDVDHRGRVWVVENVNYRPWNNPDNPPREGGDMVVILEDSDGDGKADHRTVFYQDPIVDGAMGIGVFDNQVYLSTSPHILILTDLNRDDRADRIDTLLTGMGPKQNDHAVHAVSFGPDGRLYFNYGNASRGMLRPNGSRVIDKMGNPVEWTGVPYQHGMVFRCEMDGSNVESLGHNFRNNYEVCVDSYGRMWQSDNDDDGNKAVRLNYVMEYGNYGYRDELTQASWQVSRSGMHPEIPSRHWHQNDPGVVPNLFITGSGSPCGITFYEGDLLPSAFRQQLLHADAGPGTVRMVGLTDQGAGFSAEEHPVLTRRADAWYRPTDVSVAPDGSVFASDWYDPGVGGNWSGDNARGRIFRIAPSVSKYAIPRVKVSSAKSAVKALKSPNAATRYLAWTALEQMGREAEDQLVSLWENDNPIYRARAIWLLARLNERHLQSALEDEDELLRATGIRVARQLYADKIISILQFMAKDPSAKVRREVAIALRELDSPTVPTIWADLAVQHDGKDRWYLEALGIGAMEQWDACFDAWLKRVKSKWDTPAGRDIIWRSRAQKSFAYLLRILRNTDEPAVDLARYLRATDFVVAPDKDRQLTELLALNRQDQKAFQRMLLTHLSPEYVARSNEVRRVVRTLLPELRGSGEYLDLVANLQLNEELPRLFQMVVARPDHEIGVRAAELILDLQGWERFITAIDGPQRPEVVTVLKHINQPTSKDLLQRVVLDEGEQMSLRKKAVQALAVDWGWEDRIKNLLQIENLPDEIVKTAATCLLVANRPIDRDIGIRYLDGLEGSKTEISSIESLMKLEGSVERGKEIFSTHCMSCHQVDFLGAEFGPDLSEIANKLGKHALYSAILYPDAGISPGFAGMHYEMKNGAHYQGYIVSETTDKIDIKIQNGTTQSLAKADIVATEELEHSLMTAGLAEVMGERDLVNVVEYLSTLSNQQTMNSNPYQGKIGYKREVDQE